MNCPECSKEMELVALKKRGLTWICGHCGRTVRNVDGTGRLKLPAFTASN